MNAIRTTADSVLMKYDANVLLNGLALHEFVLKQLKDCIQMPDGSVNIIGYGYGTGYIDLICTIIPSKKGIKLGLNLGSELSDPEKLLTGPGKVHRYVEFKTEKDVHNPAIARLPKEAIKAWQKRKDAKATK